MGIVSTIYVVFVFSVFAILILGCFLHCFRVRDDILPEG